jgi:outer membrane autotransporter protein
VGYEYDSLLNSSLSDLGGVLTNVDVAIQGLSSNQFYGINALGEANGDKLFRFTLSQLADISENAVQANQQVNGQLAARGSEFRSMNGFASTKPTFGNNTPSGVAGPNSDEEHGKSVEAWIRAYGSSGSKDQTGTFTAYDSSSWGTVIGVDKSFGNILVGLAGGYGHSSLDAGTAYNADVNSYQGSVYSTFGGESVFIDVALTYGVSDVEEESELYSNPAEYDADLFSFYVGGGYAFDLGEKIALTPEASLLSTFYSQDSYMRTSMLGEGQVQDWDTTSYQGSIGLSLATQHQLDWLNRGLAFIPEVRGYYIREFDTDPDNFTFMYNNTANSFAVRPRDENTFRVGFGFDMWSWKFQNAKLELDYDALFSDTYFENIVSGKLSFRF